MESNGSRVFVTGAGVVSPVGNTLEDCWRNLVAGVSGAGPITRFDASNYETKVACEVKDFSFEGVLDRKEAKRMDRFVQFAVVSDMAAGQVSIQFGFTGRNFGTVSACASGAQAIGEALRLLRAGDADVIIAGGAEATITPMAVAGFNSARALSTRNDDPKRASRPFDKDRDGFVIGEGAGILVLETEEHARRRGATLLCELSGYGASADAYHMTAPCVDGDGAARAMKRAFQDARMALDDVGYINAHGTSTPAGDPIEITAVKTVFGDGAKRLMMGSTKSMTGHLLGAAGGLEAVVTALVLARGVVPPTINLDTPDEACDLDFVAKEARSVKVKAALSNSFGFGGHNVSLAMRAIA